AATVSVSRRIPRRDPEPDRRMALVARRVMSAVDATITDVVNRCRSGLDSLAIIELTAALEEALGRELPVDLLIDCPDAQTLAARLAGPRTEDPFEQMLADAVLPDDIQPPPARALRDTRTILLTGATGFLGAALLDALLDTTDATILCLVRPTSTLAT